VKSTISKGYCDRWMLGNSQKGGAMNLALDVGLAAGYRSPSQRARRVTEGWFERNMYCPACASPRLARTAHNTRVVDFICPSCAAEYQLKAKAGTWGRKFRDAAYGPMIARAKENRSPHFAFIGYSRSAWRVEKLALVPGHFITPGTIEPCKPLSARARRAGWVGCNILFGTIPPDGKVLAVRESAAMSPETVRRKWARFSWLSQVPPDETEIRGWTLDVLRCVRTFGRREFTSKEIYAFEAELAALHPGNRTIPDQIRKQLQVLRDHGIVRFLGRGRYVAE